MTKNLYITYKNQAIQQWIAAVYETYPLETIGFMRTKKDIFSNPVGYAIQKIAEPLYDIIVGEKKDINETYEFLLELIQIRTVQNFSPEQAVGIILLYKPILQKLFLHKKQEKISFQEYLIMESKIDSLMLITFNYYVKAQSTIYEQRILEQKRQVIQLQRWAEKHNYILEKNI